MTDSEFAAALQSLGSQLTAAAINRRAYCAALAQLLHARFRTSRVNVWRLQAAPGTSARVLACEAEYGSVTLSAPPRGGLSEKEFAPYLEVLARHGVYVSNDTLSDPALESMRAGYLVPGLVEALMDAAITINGVVVGVICCEEIGRQRVWMQLEVTALRRSIAIVNSHLARLQGDDDRASLPYAV